ncbi:TetR/AcrR family transcriptional regulator [Granulicella cerasi]|uniref:TetR/AcrR family transcriptional regulator n=1 Tax=Granulicella cerasi TaxID=741063 RepID=A0ABW1Z8P9_9BACT|nr:TetR/AcrR family transcriptional regulator [Granulicella cerasi]
MPKRAATSTRREESLSRERIIEATIELLDATGEAGLTFRALSEHLATGPGAIYWHIANKNELLAAACDTVIARTVDSTPITTPEATIRAHALAIYDLIDEHPWVNSAIMTDSEGNSPLVHILERIGQQIRLLRVPKAQQWSAISTLVGYILGISKQNAVNRQFGITHNLDRSEFLDRIATKWSQLDAKTYPFTHSIADRIRTHDDRDDFIAGLNLILRGINAPAR